MTATPPETPAPTGDTVSPRTAAALRAAMDRLLAEQPQRTDGRLTKTNLWKEAGVSKVPGPEKPTVVFHCVPTTSAPWTLCASA
ncbi:hypothetical protein [Amycolatopsis keratiniphila]|uniref:hypothetical protein n=1 Tax=Amycolatopsis keratiniphila TaxID=129921 RepID=UPI00087A24D9|nr:hypothetical protein [Amycolatopsis keratiniphila]OLZ50284.1 hypothetical protein BS330_28890 [Amycolatopsis keratiniphila subsp. nogabecina]SDU67081.1 hypothetical protein SAMN04489733_8060 [Amycolatopsis keratiniphila]